jgi:hypothetical protein
VLITGLNKRESHVQFKNQTVTRSVSMEFHQSFMGINYADVAPC